MSRIRWFPVLVAVAVSAAALAACGGGSEDLTEDATLRGVESGVVDLQMTVEGLGEGVKDGEATLSGPFETGGGGLPQFDLTASVKGQDGEVEGGLALLGSAGAYIAYEGTSYEVDTDVLTELQEKMGGGLIEDSGKKLGGGSCASVASELDVSGDELIQDAEDLGSSEVGGVETTRVGGTVDVPVLVDSVIFAFMEDAGCRDKLIATGHDVKIPEQVFLRKAVKGAARSNHIEMDIGEDGIIRKLSLEFVAGQPSGAPDSPPVARVGLTLTLTEVNQPQQFSPPSNSQPLSALFEQGSLSASLPSYARSADGLATYVRREGLLRVAGGLLIEGTLPAR